jgi:UDP-N-acetylglucosamine:LPS N-acetylglucosamine transferase
MKTLIILYSRAGCRQLLRIRRRTAATIIALTPEAVALLTERSIPHQTPLEYGITPERYEEIYRRRIALFHVWGEIPVNGMPISKHLMIEGIDLWDCLENEAGEVNLENIMTACELLLSIIEHEKPDRIVSYEEVALYALPRDRVFYPDLLRAICHARAIPLKIVGKHVLSPHLLQKPFSASLNVLKRLRTYQRRKRMAYPEQRGDHRVLFFIYGTGMDKTAPVQKALLKSGIDAVTICTSGILSDSCGRYLENLQLPYAYYESFIDTGIIARTRQATARIHELWRNIERAPSSFTYRDINLFPVFRHQLEYFFRTRIPELILLTFTLEKIYRHFRPQLVINMNDSVFFGRTVVQVARREHIESLLIQHANILDVATRLSPVSDHIATWYPIGNTPEATAHRFCVTGSTKRMSLMKELQDQSRNMVRKELGLSRRQQLVVYAARFPIARDYLRIADLIEILKQEKDAVIIVKLHPADTRQSTKKMTASFDVPRLRFLQDYPFVTLLSAADLVISTDECTTSTDAVMAGVPLIIACYEKNFDQVMVDVPIGGIGLPALRAKNPGELLTDVHTLLSDPETRRGLTDAMQEYNTAHFSDDNGERMIALIKRILRMHT